MMMIVVVGFVIIIIIIFIILLQSKRVKYNNYFHACNIFHIMLLLFIRPVIISSYLKAIASATAVAILQCTEILPFHSIAHCITLYYVRMLLLEIPSFVGLAFHVQSHYIVVTYMHIIWLLASDWKSVNCISYVCMAADGGTNSNS